MNDMLRRDVTGFDQAAPTLRSEQVMAFMSPVRRPPTIAVVEARAQVVSAPSSPGATLFATVAREVVRGLIDVACRAMDTGWS
jgi:hypothetical protein